MKSTGMARKVDALGRIVLPKELRSLLTIESGDLVAISVDEDRIVLEKVEARCVFCGATTELRDFETKLVCAACVERLSGTAG